MDLILGIHILLQVDSLKQDTPILLGELNIKQGQTGASSWSLELLPCPYSPQPQQCPKIYHSGYGWSDPVSSKLKLSCWHSKIWNTMDLLPPLKDLV